jgi:type III secretory pathway component EscS
VVVDKELLPLQVLLDPAVVQVVVVEKLADLLVQALQAKEIMEEQDLAQAVAVVVVELVLLADQPLLQEPLQELQEQAQLEG